MRIINTALVAGLLIAGTAAEAKKKPAPSGLELQQLQSRDFEASKNTVFSATMSVLQDSGFRIGNADKETGFITGAGSTMEKMTWAPFVGIGSKKNTPVVSAYMEEIGPNLVRLRLNFVMAKMKSKGASGEKPVTKPEVYSDAFENIQKAVFIKEAMNQQKPPITQ